MACFKNPQESLRKQMLKGFLVIGVGSLILMAIIIAIVLTITSSQFTSKTEDALHDQTIRVAKNIGKENGDIFSQEIKNNAQGGIGFISHSASDTYRSNYSMGYVSSFFEFGDTYLKQPLIQDSRQTKDASFGASSYYFPGSEPSDIPIFTILQNTTRDNTAHTDFFSINSYLTYTSFVALYQGYQQTSMLRHYPGIGTIDTDPNRTYDPKIRGWYQTAYNNLQYQISEPYRDFNGKGWMITISISIQNSNGDFIGVVGGDLLIADVSNILNSVTYLDSGKITLFETDGQVVSDPEWVPNSNNPIEFTFRDLQNPTISNSAWNKISQTDTVSSIDLDNYIGIVNKITLYSKEYFIMVSVLNNDIFGPVDSTINEIENESQKQIGITFGIAIIIILLFSGFIFCTISQIVNPIQDSIEDMQTIKGNLGKPNLTDGVRRIRTGLGAEGHGFSEHANNMLDAIRPNNTQLDQPNPYCDPNHSYFYSPGGHAFPANIIEIITPSAPSEQLVPSAPPVQTVLQMSNQMVVTELDYLTNNVITPPSYDSHQFTHNSQFPNKSNITNESHV